VLEERANESSGDEAVADRVLAARARREVLKICDHELDAAEKNPAALDPGELYWLHASRAEALFGFGRRNEADAELVKAMAAKHDDWMIERTNDQLKALGQLLARRYGLQ